MRMFLKPFMETNTNKKVNEKNLVLQLDCLVKNKPIKQFSFLTL